jgi:hypothetical protein
MLAGTVAENLVKRRRNSLSVWAPHKSPRRIEYTPDLPRDLARRDDEADDGGLLYGSRRGGMIRVIEASSGVNPCGDLDVVGIFAARARGDVFLTEDDVARFEDLENPEAIALVVAANNAGFFVREPGGAMQTIKSYQEFPVGVVLRRKLALHRWIPTAAAALLGIALFAWPARPLEIRNEAGALRIRLHRSAMAAGARVQIIDGSERRSIPITPGLTSIVYTPVTRDVRITVTR